LPNDVAEVDEVRLLRQRHTSRAPGNQTQIAIVTQSLHDSDKMILGNAVGIANFRSGHSPIGVCAKVLKDAKSTFGV